MFTINSYVGFHGWAGLRVNRKPRPFKIINYILLRRPQSLVMAKIDSWTVGNMTHHPRDPLNLDPRDPWPMGHWQLNCHNFKTNAECRSKVNWKIRTLRDRTCSPKNLLGYGSSKTHRVFLTHSTQCHIWQPLMGWFERVIRPPNWNAYRVKRLLSSLAGFLETQTVRS